MYARGCTMNRCRMSGGVWMHQHLLHVFLPRGGNSRVAEHHRIRYATSTVKPLAVIITFVTVLCGSASAEEKMLFDFEQPTDAQPWSSLATNDAKEKEPPATIAISEQHATSAKHSLKITFAGGTWPAVTT